MGTLILLALLKAFTVVVMLGLNIAGLLTWADRRQRAVIQDSIGPNRAVAFLPAHVVKALVGAPAVLVAGAVIALQLVAPPDAGGRTARAVVLSQLFILVGWLTLLGIGGAVRTRGVRSSFDAWVASAGDPRKFVYLGFAAHGVTALLGLSLRGTEIGRTLRDFGYGAGAFLLAGAVLGGAVYTIVHLRGDTVGLRVAGLLHPAADGLKSVFKEDFVPPNADKFLHGLAPMISLFPALVVMAVVPFGDTLCFGVGANDTLDLGRLAAYVPRDGVCSEGAVKLQALDLNVGILYFFALAGTGIVGAALAGWASNNKFSLLGGLRAASQMVSYEVTLGLTIVGCIMIYGTVRLDEMVRWQVEHGWGIFVQPFAFVLFLTAAIAESKRIPFDMPEGESEIVAGYYTEYSGMKFAMFFFAEYVAIVTASALVVVLFLGGWHVPFLDRAGLHVAVGGSVLFSQPLPHAVVILLGFLGFVLKVVGMCWVQLTIRWTLPRFRYDQLMQLGWRKLLPASLLNILVTALVVLALQQASGTVQSALRTLGDATHALVAALGLVGAIAFFRLLLSPARKRRFLETSAARYAASRGGTRSATMQA